MGGGVVGRGGGVVGMGGREGGENIFGLTRRPTRGARDTPTSLASELDQTVTGVRNQDYPSHLHIFDTGGGFEDGKGG